MHQRKPYSDVMASQSPAARPDVYDARTVRRPLAFTAVSSYSPLVVTESLVTVCPGGGTCTPAPPSLDTSSRPWIGHVLRSTGDGTAVAGIGPPPVQNAGMAVA